MSKLKWNIVSFSKDNYIDNMRFLTFYFLSILYSTGISNGWLYLDAFREEYQDEFIKDSLLIINFTYLSLVIFTGIFMHSQAHQNLAKYIVDYPLKRLKYFLAIYFFNYSYYFCILQSYL